MGTDIVVCNYADTGISWTYSRGFKLVVGIGGSIDADNHIFLVIIAGTFLIILSLVIVSVYNAITDPTTTGFTDSKRALTYDTPNSDKE